MEMPSADMWLEQAKQSEDAGLCGMYLMHNGVVRQTTKASVRKIDDASLSFGEASALGASTISPSDTGLAQENLPRTGASAIDFAIDAVMVRGLVLSCDAERLQAAVREARSLPGVYYVRAWVNQGFLAVGDTMMYVLVGADIRPRCVSALEHLVEKIKTEVVIEREILSDEEFRAAVLADQTDEANGAIEVIAAAV